MTLEKREIQQKEDLRVFSFGEKTRVLQHSQQTQDGSSQASGSKGVAEAGREVEQNPLPQGPPPMAECPLVPTAGIPPAKWVGLATDCKPTVENEPVIELTGKIRGEAVQLLLDSGSTGNFIADDTARSLGLEVIKDMPEDELTLADGSRLGTLGLTTFILRCGGYKRKLTARVFPQLHKQVILGTPWLVQENPAIDWKTGQVVVSQQGNDILLPRRMEQDTETRLSLISAKQVARALRTQQVERAFVATIRRVSTTEAGDEIEDSDVESLLRSDMATQIRDILLEFRDVFATELPKGLPPVRMGHEFRIELTDDEKPVHRPIYKLSPLELEESKKQIAELLENGYIQPSDSPYGSPILFVQKKGGSLRMCVDYRWLNKKTVRNRYPLPLPDELFDRLQGAKVFSKLDLRSGYWQMPVRSEDVPKTAFRTRWGLFEFLVLPFGVTNAPAQFMNMMNDLLADYLDVFVLIFLDDILIYSRSPEEHAKHLQRVLQRLRDYHLFAKASKSYIALPTLEFLGHQVTAQGMAPTEEKLRAVQRWEQPHNEKTTRSFLGFASYYRRFIQNFARLAAPMTELTKKSVPWSWGPAQQRAFLQMKEALCKAPILQYPDAKLPYTVVTDASGIAVGGVLLQDQGDGLRPIAFLSRKLNAAEQKYSAYERELAAIAYAFISWRHYLEGCPGGVTVVTDHQPLTHLMDQAVFSRTQTRWIRLGLFQSIQPRIVYRPGKANIVADALSRSIRPEEDPEIKELQAITVRSGSQVTTPDVQAQWKIAMEEDGNLQDIIARLRQGKVIRNYRREGGVLKYIVGEQTRTVVPKGMRQTVLSECHDPPTVGHVGIRRTYDLLARTYYWRGMHRDATDYVRSCPVCQVMKPDNRASAGKLQPLPIPTKKWDQVTTDLVTDLPVAKGFTAVAVFVDRLTKMVHFAPCTKEVTAQEYAKLFLETVFKLHGLPSVLISDRDPRFTSKFWSTLFELLGTELRLSTAYHPQSDGQSEVTIRTLENFLRPYVEGHPTDWVQLLPLAEFAANNAVNMSTGFSPFYLNGGIHPELPGTLMASSSQTPNEAVNQMVNRMKVALEQAQTNLKVAQERMKGQVDKHRRPEQFQVGDEVVLSTRHLRDAALTSIPAKLRRRWVGPLKVAAEVSPVAYRLDLPPGWRIHPTFHVSHLKRYIRSDAFDRVVMPPPPQLVEGEPEYEVEAILRHRGKGARRQYLILWKGYPLEEATWEPESHLTHAPEILEEYLCRVHQTTQQSPRKKKTTR